MFCFLIFVNVFVYFFFQVYSLEDGPVNAIWRNVGFPVTIIRSNAKSAAVVDWLKYSFDHNYSLS